MAVALEQFVKQLADSGVIAPGKLENFVPPKAHPKDAQELARQLVQSKQLTKHQAQEIYQGRAKSLILGNYTIVDKIGAGGMGQVFKAEHRRMHRVVAIKMLPASVTKDAVAVARFQREVDAAAKLEHPNIVTAHDADDAGGVHFLVMQYVEGSDLSALVKKHGPLSVEKAVNYTLQAARGLEYAHKKGVIHRDIKPANLLLDNDGAVKILDMGLARLSADDDMPTQAELTGTGAVMGTVDYMAPEQALSTKHADARADIYSLGCSLCYLITGKAAYDGDTLMAKLLAHRDKPIPSLGAEVPEQLQAVFEKMVAKNIEDRYQTMSDVTAALQECVAGTSSTGTPQITSESSPSNGNLSFLAEATAHAPHHGQTKQAKPIKVETKWAKKFSRWNRKKLLRVGGAVGGGLLAAAILAAVVFKLRTKDGTLVVEVSQPDATVQVLDDAGNVKISQPGGAGTINISVDPGKHRLKVEKDGFKFFAQDFEMESGGTATIKARLEPMSAAGATHAAPLLPEIVYGSWFPLLASPDHLIGWDTPNDNVRYSNHALESRFTAFDYQVVVKDVKIRTTAKKVSGQNQNIAIYLRKSEKGDYFASFDGGNSFSIGKHVDGNWGILKSGSSPQPFDDFFGFGFSAIGDTLTLSVNGQPLLQTRDSSVAMGVVGIGGNGVGLFKDVEMLIPAKESLVADNRKPDQKPNTTLDDPAFQQWMKTVAALPAEKQVEAVSNKLMELNPGFDGKFTATDWNSRPKIENGVITECALKTDDVSDLSPIRALTGLTVLDCPSADNDGKRSLADLAPLKGLTLARLGFYWTRITDLSPLRGMPLKDLICGGSPISDLSPLQGMRLTSLDCSRSQVSDLSPLKGMPLTKLWCHITNVSDLSPIKGMPLVDLSCDFQAERDTEILRSITTLEKINEKPAAEFWKEVEQKQAKKKPGAALNDPAFQQWVKTVAAMPAQKQVEAVAKKLQELNPGFDGLVTDPPGTGSPTIKNGVVTELRFATDNVTDISPVRALGGLRFLIIGGLIEDKSELTDLSPLKGMKLTDLSFFRTHVSDLSPLRGMPLMRLNCGGTKISDLSPLRGMPLSDLVFNGTSVIDVSPLEGMKLNRVVLTPKDITKGMDVIRQMNSLTTIGLRGDRDQFPPAEFWKKYDAGEFGKPITTFNDPAFQQWMQTVAAMPAEKQVDAVSKKLQELNPGFDGIKTVMIEHGVVTEFKFVTDNVTDISPVRALVGLRKLTCNGSYEQHHWGQLSDLSPLQGMPLTTLVCNTNPVSDLSPLQGMPLTILWCGSAAVADLSSLKGMQLTELNCGHTQVSDLSPLTGMKLANLYCDHTNIGDLTPLKGMPLTVLLCDTTPVADLSPLKEMNLAGLSFTPKNITKGIDAIRRMKSLTSIGLNWEKKEQFPPDEFWKKYDAGEFGKPDSKAGGQDHYPTGTPR